MKQEKIIVLVLTALFAVGLIALVGVWLRGDAPQLGSSGRFYSTRVDVYGSATNTTLASTTSKVIAVGPEFNKVNLNIKTSSTEAQTISVYTEYSNDNNCDTTSEWFRDTRNAGVVSFSGSPNNFSVATTTFDLGIGAGLSRHTMQIGGNDVGGALNARCVKINLSTSSTTDPAILWVEGLFSN